jgi:NADPH:quinone reductase-like Zn-dependent oxidoreductase
MRAVVVTSWDRPPSIQEAPDAQVLPGEVLVRVGAAAVGHLDLDVAGGAFPVLPQLPFIPGVEAAGIVVQAPANGTVAPGDEVLVRGAGLGVMRNGSWAELVSAPLAAVEPVPAGLDLALAACFFVPTTTAAVALQQVGATAGTRVLVTGARGAVGSIAVQLAARLGCEVFASTRAPEGYRLTTEPRSGGSVRAVLAGQEAQQGVGDIDCIVDTIGGPNTVERLSLVRPGGCCAVLGYSAGAISTLTIPAWLVANVRLIPINGIAHDALARELAPSLAADLVAGALQLPVQTYGWDQIGEAMAAVRQGSIGGRAVIVP